MAHIEISQKNYEHNLSYLAKKAGGKDKLMAVLKDNAYGHDLELMAGLASDYGIQKAAVKNFSEAKRIANYFKEVLILADHPPSLLPPENISFAAHDLEGLRKFPKGSAVHLKLDTGMHRNGIIESQIKEAFSIVHSLDLRLRGVFTHFRSADEIGSEQYWQESNYKRYVYQIKELMQYHCLPMPNFHSCNSSALLRRSTPLWDDFARCGIASYGYTHINSSFGDFDLKPVMSLWAHKLSSRTLQKGDRIGYGGMYTLSDRAVVSTYDIGYGDGFFRHDGIKELVLDSGDIILGRVSMDSLAMFGDRQKVCLFKDAKVLAKHFNTIAYDVMTKLSPTVKRVLI